MENTLYRYAKYIVLLLQDLYIIANSYLYGHFVKALVFAYRTARVYDGILPPLLGGHIIYAKADAADITPIIKYFYRYTTIHSCARLQNWLKTFGHKVDTITVIFLSENKICLSKLDLNSDTELLLNKELMDGDITLDQLITTKLYELD